MSSTTDRWQAQQTFWSSFGVDAYEENSAPDARDISYPYITYQAAAARFNGNALISASIWTRCRSWQQADELSDLIEGRLKNGGVTVPYDGGIIWITAGEPFSQSMGDLTDDKVKRKLLQVALHFC